MKSKDKDLIRRLTMKDYGDTPLGALDATGDAAIFIEKLLAENAELKKELRQLDRDTMEHRHD